MFRMLRVVCILRILFVGSTHGIADVQDCAASFRRDVEYHQISALVLVEYLVTCNQKYSNYYKLSRFRLIYTIDATASLIFSLKLSPGCTS